MIIPSTVGLISHYRLGNVATRAVVPLFVGGFAGCAVGSAMAMRAPEKELQILFGVFIGVMGIRTVRKALQARKALRL